ncbi:MAG: TMEM175 family protein [Candidatus Dormibacteraeota bacterium]|nr:TMEM175 family protein [Candidatus Dormibacteraeota bacterium]
MVFRYEPLILTRLAAFSDGVFAFAIALLILAKRIPRRQAHLACAHRSQAPCAHDRMGDQRNSWAILAAVAFVSLLLRSQA